MGPENPSLLLDQAAAFYHQRQFHQAEVLVRRALSRNQELKEGWHLLGMIALEARQFPAALELISHALTLAPDDPSLHNSAGIVHKLNDELDQARNCFQAALDRRTDYAPALNNLAETQLAFGEFDKATTLYRRSIDADPSAPRNHSNLLYILNFNPTATREEIFAAHKLWGQRHAPAIAGTEHTNSPDPDRPLRIGFVSPDLCFHPTIRFLAPVLVNHDREQYPIFLYGEVTQPDETTQRLERLVRGYRSTVNKSSDEVAKMIEADQIDLLVDLAGHTLGNRFDVFARQPAPLQLSYLNYPNTTGVESIQYRLSDSIIDPPEEQQWCVERLVRIDGGFLSFEPPANAPELQPAPCLKNRYITFGSTHQIVKLNDEVLSLWAKVFSAIPDARLVIIRSTLSPAYERILRERMSRSGIDPERVRIIRPQPREDYLRFASEMDVQLDAFPFSGHTTTAEYLWMGVPTLTLKGDRPSARVGSSLLTSIGLPQFIATSPEEYLAIARHLASVPHFLGELRQALRPRIRETIGDGAKFTRRIESVYRDLWRAWCQKQ